MPAASDALLAVATERPPALLVLDRPSGATLWRVPLDAPPTASPLVRKNTIYLGTKSGVTGLRLVDGGRIWEAKSGPPSTPLVLAKNRLAYVTTAGELVVVGLEDGRVEKTLSGARAGIAPLAPPGALVYATKKGLMSYTIGSGEPRLWMNTDWLGELEYAAGDGQFPRLLRHGEERPCLRPARRMPCDERRRADPGLATCPTSASSASAATPATCPRWPKWAARPSTSAS